MANIKALVVLLAAVAVVVAFGASHVAGAGNATLSVAPVKQSVLSGIADYGGIPGKGNPGVFTVAINQNADVTTIGMQADITFDHTKLKVTGILKGAAYTTPDAETLIAGVAPQTMQDAIDSANLTGTLQNVAVSFSDRDVGNSVASGNAEGLVIQMETLPLATGSSPITISDLEVIDLNGETSTVAAPVNGQINITISPDRDGDGCNDTNEQNVTPGSQTSGGLRDFQNPYDYLNPTGDGLNRVDDILAVVNQYFDDDNDGNPGLPPYAAGYDPGTDRTQVLGGDTWDLLRGNGQQRVDDVLFAVKQYFHDC